MSRRALAFSLACLLVWAVAMALALAGCSSVGAEAAAWPESAEFSTLESGQGRFSAHGTNLDGWSVLVDHETGVQYIVGDTVHTVCPLLGADGRPLRVLEAGE